MLHAFYLNWPVPPADRRRARAQVVCALPNSNAALAHSSPTYIDFAFLSLGNTDHPALPHRCYSNRTFFNNYCFKSWFSSPLNTR